MPKPNVSIIIPSYNRERVLHRAVKSVISQTYKNWELIIVDDRSTIPAQEIITLKDPRIQIIRHSKRQGAAAARNTGMRIAQGKYIAFLDSDDEWLPEKLSKQIAFLEKSDPIVGGCVTSMCLIYGDKTTIYRGIISNFYQQSLKGDHFGPGSTLVFKKECLKKVGLQNPKLKRLEDWEWQINFSRYYQWEVLHEVLTKVYIGKAANFESVKESILALQDMMQFESVKDTKTFNDRCLYELCLGAFLDKKYIFFLYYLLVMGIKCPKYLLKQINKKIRKQL